MDKPSPWFIAMGASGAEGVRDVIALLVALPVPIQAVVLVVLHRPWDAISKLRAVLAHHCSHPVIIADERSWS